MLGVAVTAMVLGTCAQVWRVGMPTASFSSRVLQRQEVREWDVNTLFFFFLLFFFSLSFSPPLFAYTRCVWCILNKRRERMAGPKRIIPKVAETLKLARETFAENGAKAAVREYINCCGCSCHYSLPPPSFHFFPLLPLFSSRSTLLFHAPALLPATNASSTRKCAHLHRRLLRGRATLRFPEGSNEGKGRGTKESKTAITIRSAEIKVKRQEDPSS